jgi:hypothetical protein
MVLQQCLRADTDVLLPSIGPASEHKRFFVVTNTHQRAAEIIGSRVLSQLRHHQEFQSDNFAFTISHSFLPPMLRDANESMETFAEEVAAELRDHINNVCLQGVA